MMHPKERALLLDTAERLLVNNEAALEHLKQRRGAAWDSMKDRAALDAEIALVDGAVRGQRDMIDAVRALPELEVVRG